MWLKTFINFDCSRFGFRIDEPNGENYRQPNKRSFNEMCNYVIAIIIITIWHLTAINYHHLGYYGKRFNRPHHLHQHHPLHHHHQLRATQWKNRLLLIYQGNLLFLLMHICFCQEWVKIQNLDLLGKLNLRLRECLSYRELAIFALPYFVRIDFLPFLTKFYLQTILHFYIALILFLREGRTLLITVHLN